MRIRRRTSDKFLREMFRPSDTSVISFLNKVDAAEREKKALLEWGENVELAGRHTKITAWRWNFNSGRLEYAPHFREVFGFDPLEPVNYETWIGHVHPDFRENAKSSLAEFLAGTARDYHRVQAYVTAAHEIHWVETRGLLERGVLGKPERITAICVDVTETKNMEFAIRESEECFRALFEQTAVGIARLDLDCRYLQVNDRFCNITKYSREELLQMHVSDLCTEGFAKELDLRKNLLSGEIPRFTTEERYTRKDGSIAWVLRTLSLARNGVLIPQYFISVIEDITDLKRMEQELIKGRQRLEAAIAASGTATFRWDLLTNEWHWDKNITRLLGLAPGQVLNNFDDLLGVVVAEDRDTLIECCKRCAEEGNTCESEFRVLWRDGSIHHLYARGEAFSEGNGTITHITGAFLDLTSRKEMEEQIEASARLSALGMMAGGVAHEINNPLAVIHGSAVDFLRRVKKQGSVPLDIALRHGERILDTSNRIAKIIKSMRYLSREGSHDNVRATRVGKIVEETLEMCRERFKHHDIRLLVSNVDPTLSVYCREVQIGQVLLNLLQNAFDSVAQQPEERWVRLAALVRDDAVEFSVTDSGTGIPPELKTKIMYPFFTTKELGKGTGLGLSISQTIVKDHGGELDLREENGHPCFFFRLPRSRNEEQYAA